MKFGLFVFALLAMGPYDTLAQTCESDACELIISVNPQKRELTAIRRGRDAARMPVSTPRKTFGFAGHPQRSNDAHRFKLVSASEPVTLIILDKNSLIAGVETSQNPFVGRRDHYSQHLIRLKRFDAETLLGWIKVVGLERTWVEIPKTNVDEERSTQTRRKI